MKYVAAGTGHSLAITADDIVLAWGDNARGQLGDGTTDGRLRPVRAKNLTNVIAVDGGYFHTLALKGDGSRWAWGDNGGGQLDDGTLTSRSLPGKVTSPNQAGAFGAIAAGGVHSMALAHKGKVWTWGVNINGQLGSGQPHDPYHWLPTQPQYQSGVVAIAAGSAHCVTAKDDGSVWAWGNNSSGQLGNNTTSHSWVPVPTEKLRNIIIVGAGDLHSFAFYRA